VIRSLPERNTKGSLVAPEENVRRRKSEEKKKVVKRKSNADLGSINCKLRRKWAPVRKGRSFKRGGMNNTVRERALEICNLKGREAASEIRP